MMYDLFANFYTKKGNKRPRYCVLMGTFRPKTIDELEDLGFRKDPDSTPGYVDYLKDVDEGELQELTQEGYISEMMDILYSDEDFGRILIEAREVEVIDDDGNYPFRGVMMGDTFVNFTDSSPDTMVTFLLGDPYEVKCSTPCFGVPVKRVKRVLKAKTLIECIGKLQKMAKQKNWNYNALQREFQSGIDEALEIATKVFSGETDLDGNPAILHALAVGLAGNTRDEVIVGFLHDVVEDSNWTLRDLLMQGFSEVVLDAIDLLTHSDKYEPYEEYIGRIIKSGNQLAIAVKINDLRHNIARGKAGSHKELLQKHKAALDRFDAVYPNVCNKEE